MAHFVIDGSIRSATRLEPADKPDSLLDPDAIAQTYLNILRQPRSAWTWEVELRPWLSHFNPAINGLTKRDRSAILVDATLR